MDGYVILCEHLQWTLIIFSVEYAGYCWTCDADAHPLFSEGGEAVSLKQNKSRHKKQERQL